MNLLFDHTHDLDPGVEISIDMERKGFESSIPDHDID